jgi:hypothetical protein
MSVSPPFTISETLPQDSDLISIYPSQEHPFRDTVESWLTFLSDPTTGQLKATAFAFPFVIQNAASGVFFELESQDAGAVAGPNLSTYRNSASPAAADLIGGYYFYGRDSAGNKQEYGLIYGQIDDPVSTTEDGTIIQRVTVAGTPTNRLTLNAAGVTVGGALTYSGTIPGLTGTGALDSGSITSGFGSINIGTDAITAGAASFTSISGTTGTFSGAVSGTTGTFSSTVTGVAGTFSGTVTANQNFASSTVNAVFATSAAGTTFLRPNGAGSATGQFTVASNGNANSSGDLTASSDRRLKKGIAPMNHQWAWDMVAEIEPKSFIRKKSDTRSLGFIADDVEGYAPELVGRDPRGYRTLAYPNMVAILWAVVQDLQKKVQELSK